ncbi:MAG: ABC transporter substrate-binding protein [Ideonella sp.]|nr:ABC transporter substrate-binding protein [Ideonella sp.]MCC7456634.1 ABC transporter substrate-binding protein [Nitrospira sp.]
MKTRTPAPRVVPAAMAAAALAFALAAHGAEPVNLNIAMVPVLDAEPFLYAQAKGYYKEAGLSVTFSSNDAGPAVVTGVLNGTYDAAAAAWFPVAIAIAKGAKLKYVMTASYVVKGPGNGHSGVVVKPDSSIKGYKDLQGRTVATNALTSLTTLTTKMEMKAAGADPASVKFTALPFKTSLQAVAQGQVEAAVVVSPFQTEGELAGLKVIGDPILNAMPANGAGLVLFTSEASAAKKADALAAFTKATFRAAGELKASPELQRKVAQEVIGLSAEVARKVPLPGIANQPIDLDALQKQFDAAHEYGYLAHPLKARDTVLGR